MTQRVVITVDISPILTAEQAPEPATDSPSPQIQVSSYTLPESAPSAFNHSEAAPLDDYDEIDEDADTNPDDDTEFQPERAFLSNRAIWAPQDRLAQGEERLSFRERTRNKRLRGEPRSEGRVTGVVLHQTGFSRGNGLQQYDGITAHFIVAPDGQVSQLHPITTTLYSANEFNSHTVSIEFIGNFPSVQNRWWTGTPSRNKLSLAQVEAGRALLAYLKMGYPQLAYIYGHIQSAGKRRGNDPGPDIWVTIAQHAISQLGYHENPTIHQPYGGLPIPNTWRTRIPNLES